MKRSQAFPSNYLGKEDVQTPIVATIDHVTIETVKGERGEEDKPVVFFKGNVKPMILNGVNWSSIEERYGDESDNWGGCQIELYHDPNVMFGRDRVGGVRIRIPTAPRPVASTNTNANGEKPIVVAWKEYQAKHPDMNKDLAAQNYKAFLAELFPGRDPKSLSDAEWERVRAEIAMGTPQFTEAEIPF